MCHSVAIKVKQRVTSALIHVKNHTEEEEKKKEEPPQKRRKC